MSKWRRVWNAFRGERVNAEIDEELRAHLEAAKEAGREEGEARKALGATLKLREESRDVRVTAWIESLRADVIFGWRQLRKNRLTAVAAVVSLALATGSCTAAFRLVDALLLRPLPVAHAERLYVLSEHGFDPGGHYRYSDSMEYPAFEKMREATKDDAQLLAVGYADRDELTFGGDEEMERATVQFVSGEMFGAFGVGPALGRVLTQGDDVTPGGHPVAVISYDYWKGRLGKDPGVIGKRFLHGNTSYEIVGVAQEGFTGTETGTMVDVFLPAMMNPGVTHEDWSWFRTFVLLKEGVRPEVAREKASVPLQAFHEKRAKGFGGTMPQKMIDDFLHQETVLLPASAGVSMLQEDTKSALLTLCGLVGLVLLIACANVANLLTAQAAARAREMALRVSIGAGRARLVQLVLVESGMLAIAAAALGGLFAWWAAPFVVARINPPDYPVRLVLPGDWRVLVFGLALTLGVTCLFGLLPALRASSVQPSSALKGGDDPHGRRRLMHGLIAAQVAFCFLVLFVSGMFVASFERLAKQPTGFSSERVLALDVVSKRAQPMEYWDQMEARVRETPGVEAASLADWPLLDGNGRNGFVVRNGGAPSPELAYFLYVSPGWIDTMEIPLLAGRDLRDADLFPGTALINQAFADLHFRGENPLGKEFERTRGDGSNWKATVVGVVGNAKYRNMREPMTPTAYLPAHRLNDDGTPAMAGNMSVIVRTNSKNPLAMAQTLRHVVSRERSEFRVSNIRTQEGVVAATTVQDRLLAMLATFFAIVALVLAAVGLYGVLNYSVIQRRKEIGIRMAVGAKAGDVIRHVTREAALSVTLGAAAGLGLGILAARSVETMFYQVKATDWTMMAIPAAALAAGALLAAMPAAWQAVRIDPVKILRAE